MGMGMGQDGIAQLLAQLQGGQPGMQGPQQAPGVLGMLPQGHQAAAGAPPPIPGGDFGALGPYSQQELGMAGVKPMPGAQVAPPPGIAPPPQVPPGPPGGGFPGQGFPGGGPGKGSPFGGAVGTPGLFGRVR